MKFLMFMATMFFLSRSANAKETVVQIHLNDYTKAVCYSSNDRGALLYFESDAIIMDQEVQAKDHSFETSFSDLYKCQEYYVNLLKKIPISFKINGSVEVSSKTVCSEDDGTPGHRHSGQCKDFNIETVTFQLNGKEFISESTL